jgi:HK97 family phage major capsid protein/HK97 family phage prohead protease
MSVIDKAKSQTMQRTFMVSREAVDEASRTVSLAFSSEQPYERGWYEPWVEILDHQPKSVNLGRLEGNGPLLVDHDSHQQIGVVESVQIDNDRVGRAVVRFSEANPRAVQEFEDVKAGIRQHVSVGYKIHEMVLEKSHKDKPDEYRVTLWEPYEISIVAMPADTTVGVGREADLPPQDLTPNKAAFQPAQIQQERTMETAEQQAEHKKQVEAEKAQALTEMRKEAGEMLALSKKFGQEAAAEEFIREGKTLEAFRQHVLNSMPEPTPIQPARQVSLDLSQKEQQRYSLMAALEALHAKDWSKAGFEREISQDVARQMGKEPQGFFLPMVTMGRDLNVGTPSAGGNLVANQLQPAQFIDILRNKMVMMEAGITLLTGLVGNVTIPRQATAGVAAWIGEGAAAPNSEATFDTISLVNKTIAINANITRKARQQTTPDIETLIRNDLMTGIALGLDSALINGSGGANVPRGILQTPGIGSVAGGTNGAAMTWGNVVDLETLVAVANADIGALKYITNTRVRGSLKKTPVVSGQNLMIWNQQNELNGYKALTTNQIPANGTKGSGTNLSTTIFGNFADLIAALWGGLDITLDTASLATTGTWRLVCFQDMDANVRRVGSFSAMTDIVTTP